MAEQSTTEKVPARRRSPLVKRTAKPAATKTATASRGAIRPPTKSRRRPAVIAAGVALAIIGGLGSWYYASTVGNTVTVLSTQTDIARGATITSADLTTLQIAGGQDTPAFTAAQATDVIGQTATVDLPAGTLVTTANVGEGISITAGESIVGVALSLAQLPNYPLVAGDKVRLVDTPIAQGDPPASEPKSFEATVFTTRFDEATAAWVVDLVVPSKEAADIAARSATGRVALVLDSPEAE
jgi:hypothetical protein